MRVETIPLIVGGIVAVVGLFILADAWIPEGFSYSRERRRQARITRSIAGEAFIGLAVLCMAGAIIGRDTWRYGTVAMLVGSALFLIGLIMNWNYLRARISNRGELRRKPVEKQ